MRGEHFKTMILKQKRTIITILGFDDGLMIIFLIDSNKLKTCSVLKMSSFSLITKLRVKNEAKSMKTFKSDSSFA